jgi:hypothetical protein
VLDGDNVLAFTKVLTMYQLYLLEFTPSITPLYAPSPIHGIITTGIIIAFICMYIYGAYSPSYPLSLPSLPFHWCQSSPPGRTCTAFLFSDFEEETR